MWHAFQSTSPSLALWCVCMSVCICMCLQSVLCWKGSGCSCSLECLMWSWETYVRTLSGTWGSGVGCRILDVYRIPWGASISWMKLWDPGRFLWEILNCLRIPDRCMRVLRATSHKHKEGRLKEVIRCGSRFNYLFHSQHHYNYYFTQAQMSLALATLTHQMGFYYVVLRKIVLWILSKSCIVTPFYDTDKTFRKEKSIASIALCKGVSLHWSPHWRIKTKRKIITVMKKVVYFVIKSFYQFKVFKASEFSLRRFNGGGHYV